jgi:hypothetical protein
MIGRIVSIEGTPNAIAGMERDVLGRGMQKLKDLAGLKTLHAMVDRDKGKVAVVTVWNDAQSAAAAMHAMAGVRQLVEQGGMTVSVNDYDAVTGT